MLRKNQKGFSPLILAIVGIFAVGGAIAVVSFINNNQSDIQTEVDNSNAVQQSQNDGSYPDLWGQAGLPVYPNADVVKKRQGRDLVDGVQVTLNTSDSIMTAYTYYEAELPNLGLVKQGDLPSNEFTYFSIFKDSNKQISLTITKNEDGSTKIHGNYHE